MRRGKLHWKKSWQFIAYEANENCRPLFVGIHADNIKQIQRAKKKCFIEWMLRENRFVSWRIQMSGWADVEKKLSFSSLTAARWLCVCKMKLINISVNDNIHVYINHMNQNQPTEQDKKGMIRAAQTTRTALWATPLNGKKWNICFLSVFAVRYAINLLSWFTEMEYNCEYLFWNLFSYECDLGKRIEFGAFKNWPITRLLLG